MSRPDAEVVILPVVRCMRGPADGEEVIGPLAPVTDINAYRYARERAVEARREATSLMSEPAE